ncbi:hypothetical protein, partial [Heliobacterium mobile]|uniref:hypothetical protein n=1 Tax=Heliobacterium mobile TaxID=28064 RepID=UPI00147848F2
GNFYSSVPGEGITGGVTLSDDQQWHIYTLPFTASEQNTAITFLFRNDPGNYFLDDISVKKQGDLTELLKNGGFEAGAVVGTADPDVQPKQWALVGTQGLTAAGHVFYDLDSSNQPYAKTGLYYWMDGAIAGFDGIQQVVPTTIGETYTLSFALKHVNTPWMNKEAKSTARDNSLTIPVPADKQVTQLLIYAGGVPSGLQVTPAVPDLLSSVAGCTASSTGGGVGTSKESAIAWTINVDNSKNTLSRTDIVVSTGSSFKLYSDMSFNTEVSGSSSIALIEGGATSVYIKVTAPDGVSNEYYAVTINRAGQTDTTPPTWASGYPQAGTVTNTSAQV